MPSPPRCNSDTRQCRQAEGSGQVPVPTVWRSLVLEWRGLRAGHLYQAPGAGFPLRRCLCVVCEGVCACVFVFLRCFPPSSSESRASPSAGTLRSVPELAFASCLAWQTNDASSAFLLQVFRGICRSRLKPSVAPILTKRI